MRRPKCLRGAPLQRAGTWSTAKSEPERYRLAKVRGFSCFRPVPCAVGGGTPHFVPGRRSARAERLNPGHRHGEAALGSVHRHALPPFAISRNVTKLHEIDAGPLVAAVHAIFRNPLCANLPLPRSHGRHHPEPAGGTLSGSWIRAGSNGDPAHWGSFLPRRICAPGVTRRDGLATFEACRKHCGHWSGKRIRDRWSQSWPPQGSKWRKSPARRDTSPVRSRAAPSGFSDSIEAPSGRIGIGVSGKPPLESGHRGKMPILVGAILKTRSGKGHMR